MSARVYAVSVALLAFVVAAAVAGATGDGKRPRPDDVPVSQVVTETAPDAFVVYNDYCTPEHRFSSARAVIHYVVSGIDAPPLNDDDADGTPDYVERVGRAGDAAIAYFERRGFVRIRADTGGSDSRPDLYVSRFQPGCFGVAVPGCKAEGGAFAVVANDLDPSSERSFGSLYATVAHEIFHLVQFSYFAPGAERLPPDWVLEGAAAAMESRVYPGLDDLATTIQLRRWLWDSGRSLLAESYAAQLLWRYLDARNPRLLATYLAELASRRDGGSDAALLAATYARLSGRPFAAAFADFALTVVDGYPDELRPLAVVAPGERRRVTVSAFAVDYLRLRVPRNGSYRVTVAFRRRSSGVRVALAYVLESPVPGDPARPGRIAARVSDGGRAYSFVIPGRLRRSRGFASPTLVVSNGAAAGAASFSVEARHVAIVPVR